MEEKEKSEYKLGEDYYIEDGKVLIFKTALTKSEIKILYEKTKSGWVKEDWKLVYYWPNGEKY